MLKRFFTDIALVSFFALLATGCAGQGHREHNNASKLIGKWTGQQNRFEMVSMLPRILKLLKQREMLLLALKGGPGFQMAKRN